MDSRLLWGAMETLILEVIAQGQTYGYEIAQTVTARSRGYFELKEGSLYPALHRLEQQKLITSFWQQVDGRRRKYYKLGPSGARVLEERKQEWRAFARGMQGVLGFESTG
jgi:DNA-binding PadR family transcriptional regulator